MEYNTLWMCLKRRIDNQNSTNNIGNIGALLKMGDSGRKWGTGRVKAEGGFVAGEYWDDHTHYVKYGTED